MQQTLSEKKRGGARPHPRKGRYSRQVSSCEQTGRTEKLDFAAARHPKFLLQSRSLRYLQIMLIEMFPDMDHPAWDEVLLRAIEAGATCSVPVGTASASSGTAEKLFRLAHS